MLIHAIYDIRKDEMRKAHKMDASGQIPIDPLVSNLNCDSSQIIYFYLGFHI